ncbi:Ycf66 family protein [Aerosakkonemataceae cyanobacterium BLCC-F50]|uniref:Ycf66 family protein n=1 Tax=Floridaenema flaviceps BLCC-F50 TaxID=3153642 RepID=A0ABV4Y2U3_9CYAN
MLAYILALVVGTGSLAIYLAAFFLPEIHRKSDFYWSGVGLFYALVLWICAGRITGGVLLGQVASVALLGWFGWQTLTLRRELTPKWQQTELPSTEEATEKVLSEAKNLSENLKSQASKVSLPQGVSQLPQKLLGLFNSGKPKTAKPPKVKPTVTPPAASSAKTVATPPTAEVTITEITPDNPQPELDVTLNVDTTSSETPELVRPNPPDPKLVEEAVEDAEEKNLPSSPPSPFDKIEKSGS